MHPYKAMPISCMRCAENAAFTFRGFTKQSTMDLPTSLYPEVSSGGVGGNTNNVYPKIHHSGSSTMTDIAGRHLQSMVTRFKPFHHDVLSSSMGRLRMNSNDDNYPERFALDPCEQDYTDSFFKGSGLSLPVKKRRSTATSKKAVPPKAGTRHVSSKDTLTSAYLQTTARQLHDILAGKSNDGNAILIEDNSPSKEGSGASPLPPLIKGPNSRKRSLNESGDYMESVASKKRKQNADPKPVERRATRSQTSSWSSQQDKKQQSRKTTPRRPQRKLTARESSRNIPKTGESTSPIDSKQTLEEEMRTIISTTKDCIEHFLQKRQGQRGS